MASPAGTSSQEYWRPSNPEVARVIPSVRGICWRCGMDYAPGARYCHFCGGAREALNAEPMRDADKSPQPGEFENLLGRLGLSLPSMVFLVIGLVCALAALLTGAVYKQDTLVDWQAVQMWRIEWLLAAAVFLLAGILLKTKKGSA